MIKLNIGGVPEYFNLPIYQAIENDEIANQGVDLQWQDIKEGTGRMAQMLADGELDLAVILTEGITRSIISGNPSRIIKNHVTSPLEWGVHVPYSENPLPLDIENKKIAISRFGSGSHLMSYVLAKRKGWNTDKLQFEIINNLDGARASFSKGESHIFLWEKYTTQPYVDQKEFSRVDIQPTPWPCFVMAANLVSLENHGDEIVKVCNIINNSCANHLQDPALAQKIERQFGLSTEDVSQIVKEVKWSTDNKVDELAIEKVVDTLLDLGLIEQPVSVDQLVTSIG